MKTEHKGSVGDAEPQRFKQFHLPGITIIVREQVDGNDVLLEVKPMPYLTGEDFPDDAKLIRLIANIALYNIVNGQKEPKTRFNPPIELLVAYNFDDARKAGGSFENLKLGYKFDSKWEVFKDGINCDYYILPPSTAQVAEVTLREWVGDPPLAWGG